MNQIKQKPYIRAALGKSCDFILTAADTLQRLVESAEAQGLMLRTQLIPQLLVDGQDQRIVQILIFDRNESLMFPVKRTGDLPELDAYAKAMAMVTALIEKEQYRRNNGLRLVRGGKSYASKLRRKFV